VFQSTAFARNAFVAIPFAALVIALTVAIPARAEDCQTALGSSTGYTSLSNGGTTNAQKSVDEWEGEVVKLTTSLPGVFTISGSGVKSQNSLYSVAASGTHPRIDTIKLGTGVRSLQAVVRAGNHCIQVAPPSGSTGNFTVSVTFTDVCHLGDLDDHGDSFLCASLITVGGGSASGQITYSSSTADGDMFAFDLSSSATVTIESMGSTDVTATLYDSNGDVLDSDDNGGSSPNFKIIEALSAGRYYVRVEGVSTAAGSYSVSVQ
jgi:hypothetical protein